MEEVKFEQMSTEVKLKQISAVNYGATVTVFAIDEAGDFWQFMHGNWSRLKNPEDSPKPPPDVKVL